MEILGHGIDLLELRTLTASELDDFIGGWLTTHEQSQLNRKDDARHLAGRIAAKEAVSKALGTGFNDRVSWHDIEVLQEESGRPVVRLTGGAAVAAAELGIRRVLVSISHTDRAAVASAIALGVTAVNPQTECSSLRDDPS